MTNNGKRFIIIIQAVVFGLVISFYITAINSISHFPQSTDFYKFYMSSKYFWAGQNIYTINPVEKPPIHKDDSVTTSNIVKQIHPNLNSPFHTLCMSLFGLLDFRSAFFIWSLLSICCGLVAIALFYNNIVNNNMGLISLMNIWLIFLIYFPTWINIRFGQFSFVLLLLIAIAWKTSKLRKDSAAGFILGLAAGLKLFFGIFLILFLIYRRWRLIFWFISTFLACNIISLVIFKITTFETFFSLLQNMPWYAGTWNASFMGFFTRIFGGSMNIPLVNVPWLARTLSLLLSLGLLFWMIWLNRPHSCRSESDRFDLVFSLALVEMLLISPYGWIYYFPILIFPLIIAWTVSEKYYFGIMYKILIVCAWALTTIPTQFIWAEDLRMNQTIICFTSAGIYFYGLLLFSGILIVLLNKINKPLLSGE